MLEVKRARCQVRRGAIKRIKQASDETGYRVMGEIPQGSIYGQRTSEMESGLQMADALNASFPGTIELIQQQHFPHGDADDLQILFPLKPL